MLSDSPLNCLHTCVSWAALPFDAQFWAGEAYFKVGRFPRGLLHGSGIEHPYRISEEINLKHDCDPSLKVVGRGDHSRNLSALCALERPN
jgi:hypothetical protein